MDKLTFILANYKRMFIPSAAFKRPCKQMRLIKNMLQAYIEQNVLYEFAFKMLSYY